MTQVCSTTTEATSPTSTIDPTDALRVPLRKCEHWCSQGDGHPDNRFPQDRVCSSSESVHVTMAYAEPFEGHGGDWFMGNVEVLLRRWPKEDTRVLVNYQAGEVDDMWLPFTPEEANRLGHALIETAARANGAQA